MRETLADASFFPRSARHAYGEEGVVFFLFSYFTFFIHLSSSALYIWMRKILAIQFAHVAVILLPYFCLIYAAGNSNEKQVSDINSYIPNKLSPVLILTSGK